MADASEYQFSDDDDDCRSAVSNESDFNEDEEVDYLALELVHHLPADKASKLLKNLRAKEKAVQDLLYRNERLLSSCKKLDDENQALAERVKAADAAAAAATTAPAQPAQAPAASAPAPAPAKVVDNSFFLQLERSKEEKILVLRKENERLAAQVRGLDEHCRRLDEALVLARKDQKKVQQGRQQEAVPQKSGSRADANLLDEEERLYRELQGGSNSDVAVVKLQKQQAESRAKAQEALTALVSEERGRRARWGSDVAAMLLAVDGLEAQMKRAPKNPSWPADSLLSELRQVRGMGKALVSGLEEGGRALDGRASRLQAVLAGEAATGAPGSVVAGRDRPTGSAADDAAGADDERQGGSEAKKKKGKKKAGSAGGGGSGGGGALDSAATTASSAPVADDAGEASRRSAVAEAEDSLRPAEVGGEDGEDGVRPVLAGRELLQQMQALKEHNDALEARMAQRQRLASGGDMQEDDPPPIPVRRKKMYA